LVNKIGESIPCKLILQTANKDRESILGVSKLFVFYFLFLSLSRIKTNDLFFLLFVESFIGKLVEKPFLIVALFAANSSDKKKVLLWNKAKPVDKGRSFLYTLIIDVPPCY